MTALHANRCKNCSFASACDHCCDYAIDVTGEQQQERSNPVKFRNRGHHHRASSARLTVSVLFCTRVVLRKI